MRELKDYFCTYEQSLALKKLGYLSDENVLAFYVSFYETQTPDLKFEYEDEFDDFDIIQPAPLRSQALDFFRDKEFVAIKPMYNKSKKLHWFRFNYMGKNYNSLQDKSYHNAERLLIDTLIKALESEAQHGN